MYFVFMVLFTVMMVSFEKKKIVILMMLEMNMIMTMLLALYFSGNCSLNMNVFMIMLLIMVVESVLGLSIMTVASRNTSINSSITKSWF